MQTKMLIDGALVAGEGPAQAALIVRRASSTMRAVTSVPSTCIIANDTGRLKRTGPALPGLT